MDGRCIGTYYTFHCECNPGYPSHQGEFYNYKTREKSFEKRSFMRLELAFETIDYISMLKLMFRTCKALGQIFAAACVSGGEYFG